jgi:hypothetical protein
MTSECDDLQSKSLPRTRARQKTDHHRIVIQLRSEYCATANRSHGAPAGGVNFHWADLDPRELWVGSDQGHLSSASDQLPLLGDIDAARSELLLVLLVDGSFCPDGPVPLSRPGCRRHDGN